MIITHGNRRLDVADDRSDRSRLDAGEGMTFLRGMESIDAQAYQKKYPGLMARRFIPPEAGVPDWAHVRTFRIYDHAGIAKVIANGADDMGEIETSGEEFTSRIVPVGIGFGFDVMEIQACAAMGVPLDALKAIGARDAAERQVDTMLALGKVTQANGSQV